jgi:hypothetical protein
MLVSSTSSTSESSTGSPVATTQTAALASRPLTNLSAAEPIVTVQVTASASRHTITSPLAGRGINRTTSVSLLRSKTRSFTGSPSVDAQATRSSPKASKAKKASILRVAPMTTRSAAAKKKTLPASSTSPPRSATVARQPLVSSQTYRT